MKKRSKTMGYEDGTRIALAQDDVPELTDAFFKAAQPLRDAFPELADYAQKRKAGRPKSPAPKRVKSFKLSPDIIARICASGRGYNVRVEQALREALDQGRI